MSLSNVRKPELHIEILLKDHLDQIQPYEHIPRHNLEADVLPWLLHHDGFYFDACVDIKDVNIPHANLIQSVRIVDFCGPGRPDTFHEIDDVRLVLHCYRLNDPHSPIELSNGRGIMNKQQNGVQERVTELPSKTLAGTWDSLMFESINPAQTLRSIARIIVLMKQPGLNLDALNLNRLVLLHGPPGCGKTTLCRALAQKLTIRLGHHFQYGKLFELNTQSLLSKFYSESGRLVSQMFDRIIALAQDSHTLICVLIDEVESIAGSREQLRESGECHDSIRATNQLLTAMDRIRDQTNVIVLCTSNLKQAIDPAFLDRVDYEITVPPPCEGAIYEILRSTINELIRCKLITPSLCTVPESMLVGEDRVLIPSGAKTLALVDYPDSPGWIVMTLAGRCNGLSGRKLRKLPLLAITTYMWGETCSLMEALVALKKTVEIDLAKEDDFVMN